MKTILFFSGMILLIAYSRLNEANGQWSASGNHIYNSNPGYVGIGTSTPGSLLYASKNLTEPTITIRNPGGFGGATYEMIDDASGADWKFKATLNGGFKIRDHANGLDVMIIEPNSFTNALFIKNTGNIGIGTATPDNSALVDMSSATKGVLFPRMTQSQMGSISSPANALLVFCTTDNKFYTYITGTGNWKVVKFGSGTINPPFTCGSSLTINHAAGNVAPVNKTVTYGTVTGIPGEPSKCWITSNLGADHQATSVNDATEASAGWYWQFNRMQGYKHDGTTRTPGTWAYISENTNWQPANDPCYLELGYNWRIPTRTEWNNVDSVGWWNEWSDSWNSALKLHAAGYLDYAGGILMFRGTFGYYWSSSMKPPYQNSEAWFLEFSESNSIISYWIKGQGNPLRCIKN